MPLDPLLDPAVGPWTVPMILEALPGAALLLDERGVVAMSNLEWEALDGRGLEESVTLQGTAYADALAPLPGVAECVEGVLADQTLRLEVEVPIGTTDNRRWVRVVAAPVVGGGVLLLALDITAERAKADRLAHVASHDDLTGLPSRTLFQERLREALDVLEAGGHSGAVLFVDLDDFKAINDEHGHVVGDTVIRTVASRLAGALRHGDLPGRFGGDEFVVLLSRVSSYEDVVEVATRLHRSATAPIALGQGVTMQVGVSIGGAFVASATSPEAVIAAADAAMYQAKRSGKDHVAVRRC